MLGRQKMSAGYAPLGLALAQFVRYDLLAGTEDRATQACDPSAEAGGYTVGRARSDLGFLFSLSRAAFHAINALLPCPIPMSRANHKNFALFSNPSSAHKVRSFRMSRS